VLKLVKLDYFFLTKNIKIEVWVNKSHNVTEIWTVATQDHPFWSNVFNKSFTFYDSRQLHPSVTGSGYKMKI
jgi:hypothetical protein